MTARGSPYKLSRAVVMTDGGGCTDVMKMALDKMDVIVVGKTVAAPATMADLCWAIK